MLELHDGWSVVAEAADGKDAVGRAIALKPDVAIIDYSLPLLNGVEVTRQVRGRLPATEVLIFTMHESDALVEDMLEAGARGYLLKSDASQHLVAAVQALRHQRCFTGKLSEKLLESFLANRKPSDASPVDPGGTRSGGPPGSCGERQCPSSLTGAP